jgi:hypothetical protein
MGWTSYFPLEDSLVGVNRVVLTAADYFRSSPDNRTYSV